MLGEVGLFGEQLQEELVEHVGGERTSERQELVDPGEVGRSSLRRRSRRDVSGGALAPGRRCTRALGRRPRGAGRRLRAAREAPERSRRADPARRDVGH